MAHNTKVLIAEDDDSIAHLYTVYLETKNYEVRRAVDGKNALEMIAEVAPDVLLLDIMMPEKSGFDVLEEIKDENGKVPFPVIMFTALSQDVEKKRALEYGVSAYLVKSQVVISDVAEEIERIVQK